MKALFAILNVRESERETGRMDDEDTLLYKQIGIRLRTLRERSSPNYSQARLAKKLGISRASIVNIEGGRQHAPLGLLWKITSALGAELSSIIPSRADLLPDDSNAVKLNPEMLRQIKVHANGDRDLEQKLESFVGKVLKNSPAANHEGNDEQATSKKL